MKNTTTSTPPVDQQRLCSALGHLLQAVEALEDAARNPSPDPNSPPLLKCRQELRAATEHLKHGWWQCQCCKVLREPNWFTYRVRGHQKEPWIEPACAMCAREMFSEGPFPPPNDQVELPAPEKKL